jgi:CheY-like chemotaxis protein
MNSSFSFRIIPPSFRFLVSEACNGQEAVDLVRASGGFDIILLDVNSK